MRPAVLLFLAAWLAAVSSADAECPVEPTLKNYTGGGTVACPCFGTGEQAGALLNAPSDHYPIEILRVGIGWGSQDGGAPQSLEEAIHIYGTGLPSPGLPLFSLEGPQLTDGVINEFDLEPMPGEIIVPSGPFTVTLEFANPNAGDPFAPSMVHDGNGCQGGKNVVYAIPGGWNDACALGVSGDWIVYVVYRKMSCPIGVDGERVAGAGPVALFPPRPNPLTDRADLEFYLPRAERVTLAVYDVAGREVSRIAEGAFAAGRHRVSWDARDADGALGAGIYLVQLRAGSERVTQKLSIAER
ncbi:MAG TPA: FlgD immunoglobulin-like domain containing protein [Candidatus Limnocylindria bacterium]|nr:FlgD immunoglobulin-like domain containing protein [Candidatus Limnocylindria bacterium]